MRDPSELSGIASVWNPPQTTRPGSFSCAETQRNSLVNVPAEEEGVYLKPEMGALVSFLKK